MRVIRHMLGIVDQQTVTLPAAGKVLSVARSPGLPDNAIDLWTLDAEQGPSMKVDVFIVGTGNPIEGKAAEAVQVGKFVGTVVTPSGLVWHVWVGRFYR